MTIECVDSKPDVLAGELAKQYFYTNHKPDRIDLSVERSLVMWEAGVQLPALTFSAGPYQRDFDKWYHLLSSKAVNKPDVVLW